MNVLTIATLKSLFRVSVELYLLRSTLVQLPDFNGGIFSWWFMSVLLGWGLVPGVMMFVVFIYVAIWSRLCWVCVPFFGCCWLLWIIGKCCDCEIPGRECVCGSVGDTHKKNGDVTGGQAEQGGKKSLGGILGLHQGTESPGNEERLGGEALA